MMLFTFPKVDYFNRLERISKIELQQLSGKEPDEEQLVLLSSKLSIEKSVTDITTLKQQLEEVAKQIEEVLNINFLLCHYYCRR